MMSKAKSKGVLKRIGDVLGYLPLIDFEEGLRRTLSAEVETRR